MSVFDVYLVSSAADYIFDRLVPEVGIPGPQIGIVEEVPPPTSGENTGEETARVFFPESWIFQLLKTE